MGHGEISNRKEDAMKNEESLHPRIYDLKSYLEKG
jgi:hypothetical protein